MERAAKRLLLIGALFWMAWQGAAGAAPRDAWRPAQGPLMTRWARDVSPEKVHAEYPRPQMARKEWMSLNGLWEYAVTGKADEVPRAYAGKILVPFPIESALSGVMRPVSDRERLWYRRTFEVPPRWAGRRVLLHFGAVDWEATVAVNGRGVGTHRGGYDGFTLDITGALKSTGPQEVRVSVYDATGGFQSRGKQTLRPRGIFYTPTTGIWQTVWLEPAPAARVADLTLTPDVDAGALRVIAAGQGTDDTCSVEAVALDRGRPVARGSGRVGAELTLAIPRARLWSPERPFLY